MSTSEGSTPDTKPEEKPSSDSQFDSSPPPIKRSSVTDPVPPPVTAQTTTAAPKPAATTAQSTAQTTTAAPKPAATTAQSTAQANTAAPKPAATTAQSASGPSKPVVAAAQSTTAAPKPAAAPVAPLLKQGRKAMPTRRVQLPEGGEGGDNAEVANSQEAAPARRRSSGMKTTAAVVETYDEDFYDEDEESGEPSQALDNLLALMNMLLGGVKWAFGLVWSGACLLGGALPLAFNVGIFAALLYLLGEYAFSPAHSWETTDFPARLKYIIRAQSWPLVPCLLGYAVSRWKRTDAHRRFADESYRQMSFMTLTLLVYATQVSARDFHWIWVFSFLTALYSWMYWFSLCYGSPWMRRTFGQPPLATLVLLLVYCFGTIFGQDTGYIPLSSGINRKQELSDGYWEYRSMCQMMERVFCSVDGEVPRLQF